jgi:uncharacterized damage-inducible protein DinB
MTSTILSTASTLLLATTSLAAAATTGENLTQAEREQGLKYLSETRNGVVNAVKGLSEAQWKFKPAPDRWSVAEVVEHLALVEEMLTNNILANIDKAPPPNADRDVRQIDAMIVAKVPDRSTKLRAPEMITPTGRWTPDVALQHYVDGRAQTVTALKSSADLRQHAISHPVLGPLDGYEWVLAVAGHSARHLQQILEVKADPNFPVN